MEAEQLTAAAEALASDARLLLDSGRARGAALLHAEACALLLHALSGDDPNAEAGPASLPRGDTLAARLRAVWLDRSSPLSASPGDAELRAMADGLRALVPAVRARIAPEPAPEPARPPAPRRAAATREAAPVSSRKPVPRQPAVLPARPAAPAARPVPVASRKPAPARAHPHPAPGQPAAPPAPHRPISSAAFWSLIDRWGVADQDALALLGHAGGLTKRGTRPRFRLSGDEIERFHLLQTLDDALASLGQEPGAWLRTSLKAPPFKGSAPLDTLRRGGAQALRDAARALVGEGLRRSLG